MINTLLGAMSPANRTRIYGVDIQQPMHSRQGHRHNIFAVIAAGHGDLAESAWSMERKHACGSNNNGQHPGHRSDIWAGVIRTVLVLS